MKDFVICNRNSYKILNEVKESEEDNPLANKYYRQYTVIKKRPRKNANYQENKIRALADMSSTKSPTLLENG